MRLIIASLLLISSNAFGVDYLYCSLNPVTEKTAYCCEKIFYGTYGITLADCWNGYKTIDNATNVVRIELKVKLKHKENKK